MSDTQRVVDSAREVIHTTVNSGAVPGVVAGMTNDQETLFIESAGVRSVDNDQPMTDDTVFSIFSTTKALTGTVALQLVESGDLDLDSPAEEYAPAIGELQVIEASTRTVSRCCEHRRPTSRPANYCCTPPASDTTSSTRRTTASPRTMVSPASSPPPRTRSRHRCCSIPAPSGSTARISTGQARWSKASSAPASARR